MTERAEKKFETNGGVFNGLFNEFDEKYVEMMCYLEENGYDKKIIDKFRWLYDELCQEQKRER